MSEADHAPLLQQREHTRRPQKDKAVTNTAQRQQHLLGERGNLVDEGVAPSDTLYSLQLVPGGEGPEA